ncbi:MAG: tRNA pseudouridine(54/55) synthase Pus10 [Promethearchaeia archaeon]
MSIFEKVMEIYRNHHICPYCLGRMFSLLATDTTNLERGKSLLLTLTMDFHKIYLLGTDEERDKARENLVLLAAKAKFEPARNVLNKEGVSFSEKVPESCYLCHDIFFHIDKYVEKAIDIMKEWEFDHFLCGTSPAGQIINKEDQFKAKTNLTNTEAFKSHFNREVGKRIAYQIDKPVEFQNPHLTLIFSLDYDSFDIETIVKSEYIYGRYQKLVRGIPQTHWYCGNCHGDGCEECNFTGKQYQTSVEGLISPKFVEEAKAEESKFHGAGREDIDVKMLGTGRPFVIELVNPKIRSLNLSKIQEYVNTKHQGKVQITDLRKSSKDEVIKLKEEAENTRKVYKAYVNGVKELSEDQFNIILSEIKEKIENKKIQQRTPHRVAHRRADKIREKKIYSIEGTYLGPSSFEFTIESQGGTYIKELIHSDEGRTSPSIAEIMEDDLTCETLDVLEIKH